MLRIIKRFVQEIIDGVSHLLRVSTTAVKFHGTSDMWTELLPGTVRQLVGEGGEEHPSGPHVSVIPPEEEGGSKLSLITAAELRCDRRLSHPRSTNEEAYGLVARHPLLETLPHSFTGPRDVEGLVGVALRPVSSVVGMRNGINNLFFT